MRYFKKVDPRQQLLLSNGVWFSFPPFGDFGLIATEDTFLLGQFDMAMGTQRGGVSEITLAEFEDLKKKPISSPKRQPERVSIQFIRKLQRLRESAERVAANVTTTGEKVFQNITQPRQISDYRPEGIKRA